MTSPYFWPGTKIVKSLDNDFNWRTQTDFLVKFKRELKPSVSGKIGSIGRIRQALERGEQFYITAYTRARPSK